jgi:hypothetical protein
MGGYGPALSVVISGPDASRPWGKVKTQRFLQGKPETGSNFVKFRKSGV